MTKKLVASFSMGVALVALSLAACDKKDEAQGVDAEPVTETTATPPVDPPEEDTPDEPEGGTTAPRKPAVKPGAAADAGEPEDAGGTAAGTEQECCCEAKGHPLESVAMSSCAKERKGKCVKKDRCAAGGSDAKDAGATAAKDAGAVQTCCCEADGKKEIVGMSACAKERKGKCVKMAQCKE